MPETGSFHPDAVTPTVAGPDGIAPATPPVVPGYELGELIGRGGMGDVYRARDLELDRDVAVKVLRAKYEVGSSAAARFVAEARITAQLQHPGIPAVYWVSALADGRPFLAMKLIKGQTLDELLKATATLNHLAIIEAVAQTLGYAHAHDVIHRDIKPANVMVGPFGEVQVMDWGLAKVLPSGGRQPGKADLDPEATTAATVIRTTTDGSSYTQHGSVLGTPAYMPPEQAGGETYRVGFASDVFGLGALWCRLLTGHPPFSGADADSVRRNAMRGKTEEALAQLDECRAEPGVVALCKQCLAFEPADRPRDANEVAKRVADLRVAAETRARAAEVSQARAEEQAKRRRTVLAAGYVVAAALLAGLGVSLRQTYRAWAAEAQARASGAAAAAERDAKGQALAAQTKALAAETQARAAEKQTRERAFAALRSMSDDVVVRKFTQGAVLTDDDKTFLRSIIAQFDAFAAIQGDDARSRAVRAEGRFRVGTMRHRLGELKEAEEDYDAALTLRKQLAAEFPDQLESRRDLAASLNNRGALMDTTGRSKEAEADYDAAVDIRKQLVADWDGFVEFLRNRAHPNIPKRPEFRQELAESFGKRGALLSAAGRLKEAEADYDAALGISKQLVIDFPDRPKFRHDLAGDYECRATLLSDTGRTKEAEADYAAALAICQQLVADFPDQPEYRSELATIYNNRGLLLSHTDRLNEAEADHSAALDIELQLASDFPNKLGQRNILAGNCVNLALIHFRSGDLAAAKRRLDEGRPHHLAALKANPKDPSSRKFYRNHLFVRIMVHAWLEEPADAISAAETYRDLGWAPPDDAYAAAGNLGMCVSIVEQDLELDDQERRDMAKLYADAAVGVLRNAIDKGYKDAAHIKQDTNFASLRERPDFNALLADLEAKAKPPAANTPAPK